ncbi:MAG: triphosphoribosyl-dephospho-CoA synthase [Pseudomonadota bacterium]
MNAWAATFLTACELDVLALKPGNVSVDSPGHGMTAGDFRASAQAAAPHLCDCGLGVGERIHRAVAATREKVGCNTNLGILLLAAPLIHAAQHRLPDESFPQRLSRTLAGLGREDADQVFQAIRLANPGGLGRSERHDVARPATVTLLAAMHEAAARDRIARQYARGYADVFAIGLPGLRAGRARWGDETRAVGAAFMDFLAAFPDSHVLRKYGPATGQEVRAQAMACQADLERCADWPAARARLQHLDAVFKAARINPGTSADLTVAACLVERLLPDSASQRVPVAGSAPERDPRSLSDLSDRSGTSGRAGTDVHDFAADGHAILRESGEIRTAPATSSVDQPPVRPAPGLAEPTFFFSTQGGCHGKDRSRNGR